MFLVPTNEMTAQSVYGDLMLCVACEKVRFPHLDKDNDRRPTASDVKTTQRKVGIDAHGSRGSRGSSGAEAGGRDRRLVQDKKELLPTILSRPQHSDCSSSGIDKPACDDVFESTAVTGTEVTTILDELLAYASHYRDPATTGALLKVVVGFYLPAEIATAKRRLMEQFGTYLSDCPHTVTRRQSNTRSAHDAEGEDILLILDLLDNKGMITNFRFGAVDLERLPKYGPEEVNLCSVVDRQVSIDRKVDKLQSAVMLLLSQLLMIVLTNYWNIRMHYLNRWQCCSSQRRRRVVGGTYSGCTSQHLTHSARQIMQSCDLWCCRGSRPSYLAGHCHTCTSTGCRQGRAYWRRIPSWPI